MNNEVLNKAFKAFGDQEINISEASYHDRYHGMTPSKEGKNIMEQLLETHERIEHVVKDNRNDHNFSLNDSMVFKNDDQVVLLKRSGSRSGKSMTYNYIYIDLVK